MVICNQVDGLLAGFVYWCYFQPSEFCLAQLDTGLLLVTGRKMDSNYVKKNGTRNPSIHFNFQQIFIKHLLSVQ